MILIDGQFNDPKDCPKSKDGKCENPKCEGADLELDYGFSPCGYGLGGYKFCPECYAVYDFVPDKD